MTIAGNINLPGLSDGSHSLIVYAKDLAGNIGASEMIYFSVNTQRTDHLLTWIVAAIVIVAASGTAVYLFKIRKRWRGQTQSGELLTKRDFWQKQKVRVVW